MINDCSTDASLEILRQKGINFLSNPINLGIGATVQAGYMYARDKGYDIAFDEGIRFDVKGTVIPKQMREASPSCVAGLMAHPLPIIRFYYDKQSHGRRFDMQNRLFVVHHSFVDEHRELYLRCSWRTKREAYREYARNIGRIAFREWQGCKASVLFIVERRRGVAEWMIDGLGPSPRLSI